ncbi:ribonucleotide-diphosphate reductase subunit beta [Lacticaseibacillus pabuli]|uniref:Ribonucleotide-diphosphate reductase subunit beta n=1 Tax=Lacticaseibacillus pabuli TaxID=3025672 RepID=A0ABY7WUS1_9LACO|nr:ribonucleotide-diphosphate reductase subunit beta [Lacticaseibacillus sp. KACC 23028]WDF83213.1 ribonucleotide-diphosphate reductase subunit beta [Lacticaseibacillus sp. KACC 23028]
MDYLYYKAINWDDIKDNFDKYTWEKLTTNFWLDIRIPVTNDQPAWQQLADTQQQAITRMLAGASMLAVYQSEVGTPAIRHDRRTQQEESVLNTITFMKSVHAKSYTTIFRALIPGNGGANFTWADNNTDLQAEIDQLAQTSTNGTALQKKALFILTETGLSFGKYWTTLQTHSLVNTYQILANILRGSAIFSAYVGYKFHLGFEDLASSDQAELQHWINTQFDQLMQTEKDFLEANLEDATEAINLAYYGANHALTSLGFDASYEVQPSPLVAQLKKLMIDQDQFLQQMTAANNESDTEEMTDDDYDF